MRETEVIGTKHGPRGPQAVVPARRLLGMPGDQVGKQWVSNNLVDRRRRPGPNRLDYHHVASVGRHVEPASDRDPGPAETGRAVLGLTGDALVLELAALPAVQVQGGEPIPRQVERVHGNHRWAQIRRDPRWRGGTA